MGEFVAFALDAANRIDSAFHVAIIGKQFDERTGSGNQIVGHVRKHLEETRILRDEAEHWDQKAPRVSVSTTVCSGEASHYLTPCGIESNGGVLRPQTISVGDISRVGRLISLERRRIGSVERSPIDNYSGATGHSNTHPQEQRKNSARSNHDSVQERSKKEIRRHPSIVPNFGGQH